MQVRCIHPFASHQVGDVIDVPDGAQVSPVYFEPLTATPPPPEPPAPAATPAATEGAFGQPKDH